MNKSEDNALLVLATTILALISFSYLFENKKSNRSSFEVKNSGFQDDRENLKKDFSNIARDMRKTKEKLNDVIVE